MDALYTSVYSDMYSNMYFKLNLCSTKALDRQTGQNKDRYHKIGLSFRLTLLATANNLYKSVYSMGQYFTKTVVR